jgi:predicted aldo/keto reductase-like oxidoreductase
MVIIGSRARMPPAWSQIDLGRILARSPFNQEIPRILREAHKCSSRRPRKRLIQS